MAPESLSSLTYSTASDVFSVAVVFYEIAAEAEPFPELDLLAVGSGVREGKLKLKMPADTPQWLSTLCDSCWSLNPDDRPTISEVCDVFLENFA
jgi:hypothetical protein